MVGTWLGEIRSCSCLAVLPDTAWVLLNKIYQPFFTSLYRDGLEVDPRLREYRTLAPSGRGAEVQAT